MDTDFEEDKFLLNFSVSFFKAVSTTNKIPFTYWGDGMVMRKISQTCSLTEVTVSANLRPSQCFACFHPHILIFLLVEILLCLAIHDIEWFILYVAPCYSYESGLPISYRMLV